MNTFFVLYRKELLEMLRNYKWIWVPLVFILLGAMQPVTTYFLPQILAGAGNMPEGAVIEIPTPQGSEVLAQTLQQYNTLGVLIITLSFMAVISGERNSGTAAMILVKPVSYTTFVLSKWSAMLSLTAVAFTAGYAVSLYYTNILIGDVGAGGFWKSLLIYMIWLLFVGTLTVTSSALLRSPGGAAFTALGATAVLAIATSLFPKAMAWSPGKLTGLAAQSMQTGLWDEKTWMVVLLSFVIVALMIMISVLALRSKPSLDN
ncbi:ABC transporter permease [Paenibacillus abyssi]|uniref:ABC transporter permease n=1 Tax=Paenibacillus abyssi TaxID=1340531 RepID=A0A917FVI9_9BACL|nr:ABC transporter permease subunit [Paenibacillus abyssi]GGG09247.1 ABC transporter permease [Paenibacillus abyssi]